MNKLAVIGCIGASSIFLYFLFTRLLEILYPNVRLTFNSHLIVALSSVTIASILALYVKTINRLQSSNKPPQNPSPQLDFPVAASEQSKGAVKSSRSSMQLTLPYFIGKDASLTELESLLGDLIKSNLRDIEVTPRVRLKSDGKYKVLGQTWVGKVAFTIRPKEKAGEREEKPQVSVEEEEVEKPF